MCLTIVENVYALFRTYANSKPRLCISNDVASTNLGVQQLCFWAVLPVASILLFVILAHVLGGSGRQAHDDVNRLKKVKSVQAELKIVTSMCQVLQPGLCTMLNSGVWWNHVGNTMFITFS